MRKIFFINLLILSILSCKPDIETDYQAFMEDSPENSILIVNGNSETLSAIDTATGKTYQNIQTLGHSNTNRAIPNDILVNNDKIHIVLSGQNSMESYKTENFDYIDDGKHYFVNGYNPMIFIPIIDTNFVFVTGLGKDQIQLVDLDSPLTKYPFIGCYSKVEMPENSNSESQTTATTTNATGDNKPRTSTGGACLSNGSNSILYITNVRYDCSILMTSDGEIVQYDGEPVRAPGYFREATLSIFRFDIDNLDNGYELISEVNLESLFYEKTDSFDGVQSYFPGNGLNPQSAFILDGLLNVICTGTNGGSIGKYSDSEYIPDGFSVGNIKPGTNPDDGLVLIFNIGTPNEPELIKFLNIGGSPCGFRQAIDTKNKIVYLAGVGGIQAYHFGATASDYIVTQSSSNLIMGAENIESDYYSGLCFNSETSQLFVSFYSSDCVKSVQVYGSYPKLTYSNANTYDTGDGPGAMCNMIRNAP